MRTNLKSPVLTSDEAEQAAMQKLAAELGLPLAFSYNLSPTIDGNEKTRSYQVSRVLCLACEFADHENKFLETTSETERQAEMARLNQCDTVYACNVAASNFVVDYRGQMLPCMKLRAHGVPLTQQGFAAAWQVFAAYGQRKASEAYKCRAAAHDTIAMYARQKWNCCTVMPSAARNRCAVWHAYGSSSTTVKFPAKKRCDKQ